MLGKRLEEQFCCAVGVCCGRLSFPDCVCLEETMCVQRLVVNVVVWVACDVEVLLVKWLSCVDSARLDVWYVGRV